MATSLLPSIAMGASLAAAQEPTFKGQAVVVDGDTVEIHGTRIRLQVVQRSAAKDPQILHLGSNRLALDYFRSRASRTASYPAS